MSNPSDRQVRLRRIRIYPIKSLPGIELDAAILGSTGGLAGDRRWALVDRDGKFVNGKRTARMHLLQASFSPELSAIRLAAPGRAAETFSLAGSLAPLEAFMAEFFGFAVRMIEKPDGGFPDDTEAPGPTVISTATLEAVGGWFPGLTLESTRQRFRANLELDAEEAFWEDRLYGPTGSVVRFQIGDATLEGTNPCQRCVVPSRDPQSGEVYAHFVPRFSQRREQSLPVWAEASRFDHFYRLAVNTRGVERSGSSRVRIGDLVRVLNC